MQLQWFFPSEVKDFISGDFISGEKNVSFKTQSFGIQPGQLPVYSFEKPSNKTRCSI